MNNEHCSNIFLVKFALNEMEGGSDKSSKSNYLKASLQKECISLCQSSILQVIFGDGLLSTSSNKRCSNLLCICFVLSNFLPHCGTYLCLCFSRLSEIYAEHCLNISFVKFAPNEMEGGSDKSSKSNSLKVTLQKECIRFCPLHTSVAFARVQFFKLFWRRFAF